MRALPLALVLLMISGAVALPRNAHAATQHALVSEVYYDTYVSGEGDEFVRIENPTASDIDLTNWSLTDGEGTLRFPAGATLAAGAKAYVTGNASAFRLDMVVSPQWEYVVDSDPGVPNLARTGSFVLANTGDEAILKDATGAIVDAVAYANSSYAGAGWTGAKIPKVGEGVILERDRDANGAAIDTDTASDWDDARVYYAGQTHLAPASYTFHGHAQAFASPDSSYSTLFAAIGGARATIDLNMYELENLGLGDALLARAQHGVALRILMEGTPAGMAQADRDQENWILARLADAGADVRFMITNDTLGIHDRYDYTHAKYAVIDGSRALAMSGNWKVTGVPPDPTTGNREWGIVIDSPDVASYLDAVFADDFSDAHRDILHFDAGADARYHRPAANFTPDVTIPSGGYQYAYPALNVTDDMTITPVLAPDTVLMETGGLLDRLRNAHDSIEIEQMYAHQHWGTQNDTAATHPDLLLEAAISAARNNGAKVYVLLGDEYIDYEDTRNNQDTVDYIDSIRATEGIPVYARIVDSKIANLTKVHNKGVVIDNETALVSSINWGQASATLNREVALMVDNGPIAQYFSQIFWYDWAPKERVPPGDLLVARIDYFQNELTPGVPDPRNGTAFVTVTNNAALDLTMRSELTLNMTPTLLGAPVDLGTAIVPPLSAGQSATIAFPVDTFGRAGTWSFTAVADADNAIVESDETNNVWTQPIDILVPVPGIDAGIAS